MGNIPPTIVVVTRQTRLAGLKQRWVTASAAKFRLKAAHELEAAARGAPRGLPKRAPADAETDFAEYQREDDAYRQVCELLQRELDFGLPVKFLDRSYVPNVVFVNCPVVVVVGQDGLVANTAKYVEDAPIVAVNPDPARIDGILLPFAPAEARRAVARVLDDKYRRRRVTLAQVKLNDGQKMLAFNDFFVGASSHVSARYTLEIGDQSEAQSSSGVLVSTGAGSTGWMSSVFNMAAGVGRLLGADVAGAIRLEWEDRRLLWAVREPFASKHSQINLSAGVLEAGKELIVESLMPAGGVIFSDGIESDFLPFASGAIARISAAEQAANLVVA